jgi:hypothetical protein
MARQARKTNQPMTFFSTHYKGEQPYSDGDYVEIDGGFTTLEAAQRESEEGDLIVQWERKQAWKVKPRPIEQVLEKI